MPAWVQGSWGYGALPSGAVTRSEYHAYELSGRVAGSGLARRAARRRAAHNPFNSVFCLAIAVGERGDDTASAACTSILYRVCYDPPQ